MTTNSIMDAIATVLRPLGAEVNTDEVKQGHRDDSFFIDLINMVPVRQMRNTWMVSYSFDVIYFTLSKTAAYSMADQLILLLSNLTTDDGGVKGSNISYRYADADALHFLVTYTSRVYQPVEAGTLMKTNTISGNVKGE
jgi:hypothetical protein